MRTVLYVFSVYTEVPGLRCPLKTVHTRLSLENSRTQRGSFVAVAEGIKSLLGSYENPQIIGLLH